MRRVPVRRGPGRRSPGGEAQCGGSLGGGSLGGGSLRRVPGRRVPAEGPWARVPMRRGIPHFSSQAHLLLPIFIVGLRSSCLPEFCSPPTGEFSSPKSGRSLNSISVSLEAIIMISVQRYPS